MRTLSLFCACFALGALWAQSGAIPPDREPPAVPRPGDTWRDPASGMVFCWIPPGTFAMGSPTVEGRATESPSHEVKIPLGLWMGRTEVTQDQWHATMGTNPSVFQGARLRAPAREQQELPVEGVAWDEAKVFLDRLRRKGEGRLYRLPTEAEWE